MLMLRVASREHGTLTLSMPTSFDRIGGRHNFATLRLCVRLVCDTFAERKATMEDLLASRLRSHLANVLQAGCDSVYRFDNYLLDPFAILWIFCLAESFQ